MPEEGAQVQRKKRAGGLDLLRQVYDELYTELSEEYSPAELLAAAQTLIDVTDEEYVDPREVARANRPGYFSIDVFRQITGRPWLVLENEEHNDGLSDDRFLMDYETKEKIGRFHRPDRYYHRG